MDDLEISMKVHGRTVDTHEITDYPCFPTPKGRANLVRIGKGLHPAYDYGVQQKILIENTLEMLQRLKKSVPDPESIAELDLGQEEPCLAMN